LGAFLLATNADDKKRKKKRYSERWRRSTSEFLWKRKTSVQVRSEKGGNFLILQRNPPLSIEQKTLCEQNRKGLKRAAGPSELGGGGESTLLGDKKKNEGAKKKNNMRLIFKERAFFYQLYEKTRPKKSTKLRKGDANPGTRRGEKNSQK